MRTEICPLTHTDTDTLFKAFSEAFSDYEKKWSEAEFFKMLQRRGYDPELSFGAFCEGKLVSFTFNGTGFFMGKPTVYDTGTGTIPAFRGQGLAGQIFQHSVPVLTSAGFSQYLLEVLTTNESALKIYLNEGFRINRTLCYFVQPIGGLVIQAPVPAGYEFRATDQHEVMMEGFMDFYPSWQNSFGALRRNPADFLTIGAYHDDELVGYGVIEAGSGDISQLAVKKEYRRKGIGSHLMYQLLRHNRSEIVKIVNSDASCVAFTSFLKKHGIEKKGAQYEMIRKLRD